MSAVLTTTARELRTKAAIGNYMAETRDTSKEDHSRKVYVEPSWTILSGTVAAVTRAERLTTFVDVATGRLYKPTITE